MKPLLRMLSHSKDDIYIKYGNEKEYSESFEDCLVNETEVRPDGKKVFYLGRNTVAFKIVNQMLCGMAGRTFH